MVKERRSFLAEFKHEAAGLVLNQGYSYVEASRSLEIAESTLLRWVNQLRACYELIPSRCRSGMQPPRPYPTDVSDEE